MNKVNSISTDEIGMFKTSNAMSSNTRLIDAERDIVKSYHCLTMQEVANNLSLPARNSLPLKIALQKQGVLLLSDKGKLVAPAFQFIQPNSINVLIKDVKIKANERGLSDVHVCLFLTETRDIERFIPNLDSAKSLSEAAALGAKSDFLINERPIDLIKKQDEKTFTLAVEGWLNPLSYELPHESTQSN